MTVIHHLNLNSEWDGEKQRQNSKLSTSLSSQAQHHSCLPTTLYPYPSEWCRGSGNGSSGQFITLFLCLSSLVMMFPCSITGSSHGFQSFRSRLFLCGSSLWTTAWISAPTMVLHELPGSNSGHQGSHHRLWWGGISAPASSGCILESDENRLGQRGCTLLTKAPPAAPQLAM